MKEDSPEQNYNWVTLTNFTYPHEYMMLVSFLESNGIIVFPRNETLVAVDPFLSNAVGGIDLMVPDTQLDEAKKLYAEFSKTESDAKEESDNSEDK